MKPCVTDQLLTDFSSIVSLALTRGFSRVEARWSDFFPEREKNLPRQEKKRSDVFREGPTAPVVYFRRFKPQNFSRRKHCCQTERFIFKYQDYALYCAQRCLSIEVWWYPLVISVYVRTDQDAVHMPSLAVRRPRRGRIRATFFI